MSTVLVVGCLVMTVLEQSVAFSVLCIIYGEGAKM